MSYPALSWVTTMALADLRALARRSAPMPEPVHRNPTPELVTPVTREPMPMGNRREAQKTAEIRQSHGGVTRVIHVTGDFDNAGAEERAAPANDLVPTEPDAADDPPPLVVKPIQGLPQAEWVEAMAVALMANPVNRITDPEKAMEYYRGRALAMLDATPDPYARGLMLGYERHRHALVAPSSAST